MAKKSLAVVRKDIAAVATVKSAYHIALSPVALLKMKELEDLVDYAEEQTALAEDVRIIDADTDAEGKNLLVNLRKARKAAEELQKFFTSPLEASKKTVIATFKALSAAAGEQEDRLAREAGEFYMLGISKAREAAAETQRKQDEAAAKARKLGQAPKPVFVAPPVQAPERLTEAENGSVGMGTEFKAQFQEGVNLELVPRQYLVLSEKLVNAAVASGVRVIPGITIREVAKLAVR
jgi:hypothetical protein